VFLRECYFYCTLSREAEFPNYPKYCLSEIGSAPFISDNRGSTVLEQFGIDNKGINKGREKAEEIFMSLSGTRSSSAVFLHISMFNTNNTHTVII
jgi:hypothetical protein